MNGLLADPLRLSLAPCDHGGSAAMGEREVSFEVARWSEPELPPCLDKLVSEAVRAWLKFAKRVSDVCTIAKQDAVDCALCHGWIDGQLDKLDEKHWLIRFSPRTKTSKWSEKNRARANELIAKGRMRKSGLREIARAKQDGRWDAAYPSQSRAVVPADLQRALDENTEAKAFFLALDGHNRYAVLYRVHNSKNAKSRAANIAKFVAMLERGE